MKRADRDRLLQLCRDGYPVAAARAKVGISKRDVAAAGERFAADLEDAAEQGRAMIASVLIERGLDPKTRDTGALRTALDLMGDDGDAGLVVTLNRMTEPAMDALVARLDPAALQRWQRVLRAGGAPLYGFLQELADELAAEPEPVAPPAYPDMPVRPPQATPDAAAATTTPPAPAPAPDGATAGAEAASGPVRREWIDGQWHEGEELEAVENEALEELGRQQRIEAVERKCKALRKRLDGGLAPGFAREDVERELAAAQSEWQQLRVEQQDTEVATA